MKIQLLWNKGHTYMAITLTDSKIWSFKQTGKDYRISDSNGLYIKVSKTGKKSWQFRYKD